MLHIIIVIASPRQAVIVRDVWLIVHCVLYAQPCPFYMDTIVIHN